MAGTAIMFLQVQLKDVMVRHADLIGGAEAEFYLLCIDLDLLEAFVKDTAVKEKKEKDGSLRLLKMKIRDVMYEVEETVYTCLASARAAKSKTSLLSGTKQDNLVKEVRSIREDKVRPLLDTVSSIAKGRAMEDPQTQLKMAISPSFSCGYETPIRETPIRQERVVGFEYEEKNIIDSLMEKTEHLDVISIVGMPGLGKTTLARKIYQSDYIGFHFPILIWIYISGSFNSRNLFLQILKKFTTSQDTSYLSDDELALTVRECMEKEKFLLVLDDVWSVDAWHEIKEVLPLDNGEGKVLITTRELYVGHRCSVVYRHPHCLRGLTMYESWMLLQYEVFGELEVCPQELSHLGIRIAEMCDGLPLRIVVVGGVLADQLNKFTFESAVSGWEKVSISMSEALQSDVMHGSNGVIELSYQGLPEDLRECFLFLGVFPDAYEIPAKMLCRLWISEGFVFARDGISLEERAEENMNYLIRRNLLKVEKTNHFGKVKTCRVHDMIREFCLSISRAEKFYQHIGESSRIAISEEIDSHRLCVSSNLSRFLSYVPYGPHIRSFLCFYEQPVELEPQYISVIPDSFKTLRVLESKCIILDQFPAKFIQLVCLRYLTLCIENLTFLPESIAQLWNLQSLVVETNCRYVTMKANVWTMVHLRCLKTRAVINLDDKWEGEGGQNLRTLNKLAAESCTQAVSRRLEHLNTLGISGKLASVFQTGFLETFTFLEKLKLEDRIPNSLHRNCYPPNLKRLTLVNTSLGWKHMPTLAMIRSLEVLKLRDNAFVGESWRVHGYSFPHLQFLLMVNMNLIQWEASTDAFPSLRFLEVNNCENLREIPMCLGRHLEKLEVYRVGVSVVESAMKIAKTNKRKPKGKFGVEFNLSIGAAWRTKLFELECNILFGERFK